MGLIKHIADSDEVFGYNSVINGGARRFKGATVQLLVGIMSAKSYIEFYTKLPQGFEVVRFELLGRFLETFCSLGGTS